MSRPGRLGLGALVLALALAAPDRAEFASGPALASPELPAVVFGAEAPALPAPDPPPELQRRLQALAADYRDPVGIAVLDLEQGWTAGVDLDGVYPQQSVSKLWVALTLMDAVDRGERGLFDPVLVTDADRSVFYQPIARQIGPGGYRTDLADLMRRALVESDNLANDKLLREVGGVPAVDAVLQARGLAGLKVGAEERHLQSEIAGLAWRPEHGFGQAFKLERAALSPAARDAALAAYLEDPADGASPRALVEALAALKRGRLLSPGSTELFLSTMSAAVTGPNRLRAGLPPDWSLAHKTGTGQDWRGGSIGVNDVGLATAPDGRPYAIAVLMRRTYKPVPARLRFMQDVARAVVESWEAERAAPTEVAAAP